MSDESVKHSPEPWAFNHEEHSVVDANGYLVADIQGEAGDPRRIAAAVNAVAGIPTEVLESGALGKALDACVALHEYEQTGGPAFLDWDKKFHVAVEALRALGRI